MPVARFSGERLRELRTARGLRRDELAVAVGRSYGVEVRWERGFAIPDANDAIRIAEQLGVGVSELFVEVPAAVA
jgi:transcriptional regulator with XRE-family HTH domain